MRDKKLDYRCLSKCPKCKSRNVKVVQHEADKEYDTQMIECQDCGAWWIATWKLVEAFIEEDNNE